MKQRKKPTRRPMILILIGATGLICSLSILFVRAIFPGDPPPGMPSDQVQQVCDLLLPINSRDDFCRFRLDQNYRTLQAMLERNFPVLNATYDDLLPMVASLPTRPDYQSLAAYEPGSCPAPQTHGSAYRCEVQVTEDINLRIAFDATGVVMQYEASLVTPSPS